jgi:fucose 4-O-acetylase-like acetyltransferase
LAIAYSAYYAIYVAPLPGTFIPWFGDAVSALLISSEGLYREATGFGFFWFLPAFIALTGLRVLWTRVPPVGRRILAVAILLAHGFVGLVPRESLPYFPFSLPLVLVVFPLGILVRVLWDAFGGSRWFYATAALVFVACVWLGVETSSYAAFAGDPMVPSILDPLQLLFHDIYLVAAFFAILGAAKLLVLKPLLSLGRNSLCIFLVHSFLYQVLYRAFPDVLHLRAGGADSAIAIALIVVAVLGMSLAVCRALRLLPGVGPFLGSR